MPVNALFSFLIKKRLQQIELFRSHPHQAQLEVFHNLMRSARNTEWGRHYQYDEIHNPDVFRERVPLQDYVMGSGSTEFSVPRLTTYAVVDLARTAP